jgi:hypothetical protein
MSHFILVKDSHPSDIRFRKALQAFSDRLLIDKSSFVTVIFWDRYQSSCQLPRSERLKYTAILPFLLTSNSFFLSKPIWCFAVFVYVFLLRMRDLFKGVRTILYCADFLAAFSCSLHCIIFGKGCNLLYDIYDEVGLLFKNKAIARLFTFLDFFPHFAAHRIVKVSHNRLPYSTRLIIKRAFLAEANFNKLFLIIPNSPTFYLDYNQLCNREPPRLCASNSAPSRIHDEKSIPLHGGFFVVSGYLSDSRGIGSILKFAKDFSEYQFCIIGTGLSPFSHKIIDSLPNVSLYQPLAQLDLFRLQLDAIGIFSLYDPIIPINRLAVPNKVWDSVICRVPLIVNSEILATADPLLGHQCVSVPYHYDSISWAHLSESCLAQKRFLLSCTDQAPSIPDSVSLYSSLIDKAG